MNNQTNQAVASLCSRRDLEWVNKASSNNNQFDLYEKDFSHMGLTYSDLWVVTINTIQDVFAFNKCFSSNTYCLFLHSFSNI